MHTASLGRRDGHKSPHQARAFRRGLDVVTSAEIRPSRRTNDAVCFFSYEYLSETAKSNCAVKRMEESARWADLTIRLVVEANCMSARKLYIVASELKDPICHSDECQIGSFSSEATISISAYCFVMIYSCLWRYICNTKCESYWKRYNYYILFNYVNRRSIDS